MTVEWTEDALDRLADIYTDAPAAERDGIASGAERINARLAADPWELGESRGPRQRVWFHHPLVVEYHLPPGGVVVFHVAKLSPRRQAG